MEDCIFCKITAGEIPSKKVYEDEDFYAFEDIAPVAPVHVLVIPKKHVKSIAALTQVMRLWQDACSLPFKKWQPLWALLKTGIA